MIDNQSLHGSSVAGSGPDATQDPMILIMAP